MSESFVQNIEQYTKWKCAHCGQNLIIAPVEIDYLNNRGFKLDLPQCPGCGMCLVPEDLALGKMLEVERTLEDK